MDSDNFLNFRWDIFLSHICEFNAISKSFIKKYEYELDWNSLSKNKIIDWDIDFLSKYESKFLWHELAWNESIIWTEEKIEKFKKRLDWYYLGRNINLPISEQFIEKYSKKLFVIENNKLLTETLIQKFSIKILPKNDFDTQDIKALNLAEIDVFLDNYKFHHNQKIIYTEIILPILNLKGLENIFTKKFNYSQRYYFLSPIQNDIYGLTPEFEIEGQNPFNVFNEDRSLLEFKNKLNLINGSLQEGPDRLYEIPRLRSFSFYTNILVSENVKSIFDQFKLPAHKYFEVNLKPKKITTTTKFYILQIEFDTINKDLNYKEKKYFYSFKDFNNSGFGVVTEHIENYSEYNKITDKLKSKYSRNGYGVNVTIRPNEYELNSDFDLYTYTIHGKIIINQYLKDALEKNFPTQILFQSAQLLNIKINKEKFDEKIKLNINTKLSSRLSFNQSEDDKFYFAKIERIEKEPIEIISLINDKFTKKEIELNVVFPKFFKENYLQNRIKIEDYTLLPISKFYIQNEYADRNPETYKSVVVAENGVGDSINLILEPESDIQLQNKLCEFFHETGEYEEK